MGNASPFLRRLAMREETTDPGTLETSGPYQLVTTSGDTFDPGAESTQLQDPSNASGTLYQVSAESVFDAASPTFTVVVRYNDNRLVLAPSLRNAGFPAEVEVTGTADLEFIVAGTHQDGSTGPQIKAVGSTTLFDPFINYDGVPAAGTYPAGKIEGFMLKVTDAVNADNNGKRRCKAVWKDPTDSYIDIMPGYVTGSAGLYAAPLIAELASSATISVGSGIRPLGCAGVDRYFSLLWQSCNLTSGNSWNYANGVYWDGIAGFSLSAGEPITMDFAGLANGTESLLDADPTGQGFDIAGDTNVHSPMMEGSNSLRTAAIVTDTQSVVVSGFSMKTLEFSMPQGVEGEDEVAGTTERRGVRPGTFALTGSTTFVIKDDPRTTIVRNIASKQTREKGTIDVNLRDGDGNEISIGLLRNTFSQPQAAGTEYTLDFTSAQYTRWAGPCVWQEWAAA